MSNLTLEEQESSITWNERDKIAEVATFTPRWQKAIERMGIQPFEVSNDGCRFYHVPKARLPLPRAARQLSTERRAKLVAALAKGRRGRPAKTSATPTAKGAKRAN